MDEYNDQTAPDQSIRSKLNKMFTRYNWVGIKNPLDVEFSWPVALEQNEIMDFAPGGLPGEEHMANNKSGTFLGTDGPTRQQSKIVKVNIKPSEKRMIMGEAAYVVVPRLFNALVRKRYGTDKPSLAKLRNPTIQAQLLKKIVVGPIINNVGEAMQTFVDDKMKSIEGFTDVQANPPKGFNNPEVLAKAQATRDANKAAKAQTV